MNDNKIIDFNKVKNNSSSSSKTIPNKNDDAYLDEEDKDKKSEKKLDKKSKNTNAKVKKEEEIVKNKDKSNSNKNSKSKSLLNDYDHNQDAYDKELDEKKKKNKNKKINDSINDDDNEFEEESINNLDIEEKNLKKKPNNIVDFNEKESIKIKENYLKEKKFKEKELQKKLNESSNTIKSIKGRNNKEFEKEIKLDLLNPGVIKRKNVVFDIFLYVLAFILFLIITINLPIFKVKQLTINGNTTISNEEIEELVEFDKNNNFLFLYYKPLEKMILKNPMIKDAKVRYAFPNQVIIKVEEIIISGYIPYLDEYIYIDTSGKVVNISNEILPNIPLIKGLNFSSFSLGNVLDVTNKESLTIIIELANIINKYMINTNVAIIDIMQLDDIKIIYGKTEIILGSMENCDYKLRKAIEIIKKLPPDAYGYLNVSSSSNRSVFTFK